MERSRSRWKLCPAATASGSGESGRLSVCELSSSVDASASAASTVWMFYASAPRPQANAPGGELSWLARTANRSGPRGGRRVRRLSSFWFHFSFYRTEQEDERVQLSPFEVTELKYGPREWLLAYIRKLLANGNRQQIKNNKSKNI